MGRTLLGSLDATTLGSLFGNAPLKSYTHQTPTTLKKLKAMIDHDRAQGYGISQGGFETGISTVVAPVFGDGHDVIAAVSITVPAQQIAPARATTLVKAVRSAAAQLSARISHPAANRTAPRSDLQKLAA